MRLTKKLQVLGLISVLALTGCSKADNNATGSNATTNSTAEGAQDSTDTTEGSTEDATDAAEESADESQDAKENGYPFTLTVSDSEGNTFEQTFTEAPTRVITNNQSSLELLLKLGLRDTIVGTISLDNDLPEELQAEFEGINVLTTTKQDPAKEVVIGSSPDLVIGRVASFTDENFGTIESLNEVGANVYVQEASQMNTEQSLENIILDVRNVGQIFQVEAAETLASELEQRLAAVKEQINSVESESIRVLVMVAYNDGSFGTFGANASLQNEMLATLNAVNVLDMGGSQSLENLIALNPDMIIYVTADKNKDLDEVAIQSLKENELLSSVTAIANDNIVEVNYTEFMGYGYRTFDCLERLAATVLEIASK